MCIRDRFSNDRLSYSFISADNASQTYSIGGTIDGGLGTDTFSLDFSDNYFYHPWGGGTWDQGDGGDWTLNLSQLSLTGIEAIEATGYQAYRSWAYPTEFILSADQLSSITHANGLKKV